MIELLFRFGLCKDENLPVTILRDRRESRLDVMLKCLNIDANNWDQDAKVEAILVQLAWERPLNTSQGIWSPFLQMDGMDAGRIADDLTRSGVASLRIFHSRIGSCVLTRQHPPQTLNIPPPK